MPQRILITDDDELVLMSLEELLGAEGYEIVTASNGRKALELAGKETFDAVFLDIIMPGGMTGTEVCKLLRLNDKYKTVPIVMLTAKNTESDRKQGMEAGADYFLAKPTDPVKLIEIVKRILP